MFPQIHLLRPNPQGGTAGRWASGIGLGYGGTLRELVRSFHQVRQQGEGTIYKLESKPSPDTTESASTSLFDFRALKAVSIMFINYKVYFSNSSLEALKCTHFTDAETLYGLGKLSTLPKSQTLSAAKIQTQFKLVPKPTCLNQG